MRCRFTAGVLTIALCAGLLATSMPQASASSQGRKNTTLGLGALAAYELLRGHTGTGLLAGAGAAYAYKKYDDARKQESRSSRYRRSSYRGSGYAAVPARNSGHIADRNQRGSSYTTDTWGNRHYYDPRTGDGYHQYRVGYQEPVSRVAGYRSGSGSGNGGRATVHPRRN